MAKKRRTKTITRKRAARLFRLVKLLSLKPQPRDALTRQLKLSVRDFYRDRRDLHKRGIELALRNGLYFLLDNVNHVQSRLPFPDPGLTLGDALQLAKGRSAAHRKLKEQIAVITGE